LRRRRRKRRRKTEDDDRKKHLYLYSHEVISYPAVREMVVAK